MKFIRNLNYKKDLVPLQSFNNFFQYQYPATHTNLFHQPYLFIFRNSLQINLENDEYFHLPPIYFCEDDPTTIYKFVCLSFPFSILFVSLL